MILPGKAWLEFRMEEVVEEGIAKTKIIQEASYSPRGLGGSLYWFGVLPFHAFVFPTMLRNIVRSAKRKDFHSNA
jgi:hypothetical protein